MNDLIEYASRFDPAFPSRIEGASAEEIERIERAAKVALPPDYRRYLELMGRNDDGLFGSDEFAHTAADIAEFYEHDESEEYFFPDDCIAVGVGTLSPELLCIERQPPHRVVETQGREKLRAWAASLRALLHRTAFIRDAHKRRKRVIRFSPEGRAERLPRALFRRMHLVDRLCKALNVRTAPQPPASR